MPKIAEIKEIDGDIWCRIGKPWQSGSSSITLWTTEEKEAFYQSAFDDGVESTKETAPPSSVEGETPKAPPKAPDAEPHLIEAKTLEQEQCRQLIHSKAPDAEPPTDNTLSKAYAMLSPTAQQPELSEDVDELVLVADAIEEELLYQYGHSHRPTTIAIARKALATITRKGS